MPTPVRFQRTRLGVLRFFILSNGNTKSVIIQSASFLTNTTKVIVGFGLETTSFVKTTGVGDFTIGGIKEESEEAARCVFATLIIDAYLLTKWVSLSWQNT